MRYPLAQISYGEEEIDAVVDTLRDGRTTAGPRVTEFEQAFASYVGRERAVMVNSGSSADLLLAFGLDHTSNDDEILVPAVTWPTQVSSCLAAGYQVRLIDVDPKTLNFSLPDVQKKMSTRVKAIFPAHILGNMGDMGGLVSLANQTGVPIIEDCCEALGSTWRGKHVGTFGKAAAFSFFFSHLITTMEGGMVVCGNEQDERGYRLMRTHGWEPIADEYFHFPSWGFNLRPTELQGAFGTVQIARANSFLWARKRNYDRLLSRTDYPGIFASVTILPNAEPAWHGFPLMLTEDAPFTRKTLARHLESHGIETRPIVAGNLARQPAALFDPRIYTGRLPGADQVHEMGMYIGLASYDDEDGTAYVGQVIRDFMRAY